MTKTNTTTIQKDINQLDEIIKYFETSGEDFDLDKAIKNYEEAMQLVHNVKKELEAVELKINEIKEKYEIDTEAETDPTPEMPF